MTENVENVINGINEANKNLSEESLATIAQDIYETAHGGLYTENGQTIEQSLFDGEQQGITD